MNITRITSAALVVLSLAACAEVQNNPKRSMGTLVGAGLGALAGSQIGSEFGLGNGYELVFSLDANVINVKQYGAQGDGKTDDTISILSAIRDAGENPWPVKIVFFPAGVYMVSDTLLKRKPNGEWQGDMYLRGQNKENTVIKLADKAPGYDDPDNPKAVILTTSYLFGNSTPTGGGRDWTNLGEGNEAFRNYISNLTVDTGSGNPGAIGIDYLANNVGAVRGVIIRSGDGEGRIGLSMTRKWPGPALVSDVHIDGFDYGIAVDHPEYGVTLEHITLENQRVVGIRNSRNVLAIRDLTTINSVPAIENLNDGLIVVIDGMFHGGSSRWSAIQNNGKIYARNIVTSGYKSAIDGVSGVSIDEYFSPTVPRMFPPPARSLQLSVQDTPVESYQDAGEWVSVDSFGAIAQDKRNDRQAIQAAIDSGATTIYFPNGQYFINGPIYIRGNVRRMVGMGSHLIPTYHHPWTDVSNPVPVFHVMDGSSDVVVFENFIWNGRWFNKNPAVVDATVIFKHDSVRTLVIKDSQFGGIVTNSRGAGFLFMENVCCPKLRLEGSQNVWIRQFNTEGGGVRVINNGANLWILGIKTEGANTVISTKGGGRSEVVGGLLYPVRSVPKDLPAFINEDSYHSLIYAVSAYSRDRNYEVHVEETRHGVTNRLRRSDLHSRGFGSLMPFRNLAAADDRENATR